jgi:hypothetical protein
MIIDIKNNSINKTFVQDYFLRQNNNDFETAASVMACATHVPVIVCVIWIGEILGWTPEVINKIKRLKKFYRYTKIIGAPEDLVL